MTARSYLLYPGTRYAWGSLKFRFTPRSDSVETDDYEQTVTINSLKKTIDKYKRIKLATLQKPGHDGGNIDWTDGKNHLVTWIGPASRYFVNRYTEATTKLNELGGLTYDPSDVTRVFFRYSSDITIHPSITELSGEGGATQHLNSFQRYYYHNGKKYNTAEFVTGAAVTVVNNKVFRLVMTLVCNNSYLDFDEKGINITAFPESVLNTNIFTEKLTVFDRDGNSQLLLTITYPRIGIGKKFIPTPWFFSQDGTEAQAIRSYLYRPALKPDGVTDNTPDESQFAFRYQKNLPVKITLTTPGIDISSWTATEEWITDTSIFSTGSHYLEDTYTETQTQDISVDHTTTNNIVYQYVAVQTYTLYYLGDLSVSKDIDNGVISGVTPIAVDYIDNVAVYMYLQYNLTYTKHESASIKDNDSVPIYNSYISEFSKSGSINLKTTNGFDYVIETISHSESTDRTTEGDNETVNELNSSSKTDTINNIVFADMRNQLIALEKYSLTESLTETLSGDVLSDSDGYYANVSGSLEYETSSNNHYFLLYEGNTNTYSELLSPNSYTATTTITKSSRPVIYYTDIQTVQHDDIFDLEDELVAASTYDPYSFSLSNQINYDLIIPNAASNINGLSDPAHEYIVSAYSAIALQLHYQTEAGTTVGVFRTNITAAIESFRNKQYGETRIESLFCVVGQPFSANSNYYIISLRFLDRSHLVDELGNPLDDNTILGRAKWVLINKDNFFSDIPSIDGINVRYYPVRLIR